MIPLFISKNEMTISTRREFLSTPMCLMYPRGLRPTSADEDRGRSIKRWRMITTLRTEVSPVGIGLHQQRQTTARRRLIAAAGHKPRPPVRWIATGLLYLRTAAPLQRLHYPFGSATRRPNRIRRTRLIGPHENDRAPLALSVQGANGAPRSRPSSTVATGSWSRHTSRSRTDSRQSATIFYIRQSNREVRGNSGVGFFGRGGNVRGVVKNKEFLLVNFSPRGGQPKITTGSITP